MVEAIKREIWYAREQARPLLRIRVTTDALQGSPVAVPITPEQARQIRLVAVPLPEGETAVEADPHVYMRALELIVHPADWSDVLAHPIMRYVLPGDDGRIREFMGLPVV